MLQVTKLVFRRPWAAKKMVQNVVQNVVFAIVLNIVFNCIFITFYNMLDCPSSTNTFVYHATSTDNFREIRGRKFSMSDKHAREPEIKGPVWPKHE